DRKKVCAADIEWVVHNSQLVPRPDRSIPESPQVGVVNGLAVYGPNMGALLELEVTATPAEEPGKGRVRITGMVEEEELGDSRRTLRRKSTARSSVENVLTVLHQMGTNPYNYHLHIN